MNRFASSLVLSSFVALHAGCAGPRVEDPIRPGQKVDSIAELQTKLGIGYLRQGKHELAWRRLTRALEIEPRYSTAHNAMALLYERIDQTDKAREHYSRAIRYNSNDSSAHTNYGSFLCRLGEVEAAEVQFRQALSNPLYETPEIPHTNLGLCLLGAGRLKDAEASLRKALELNPRIPAALFAMSDISFRNGEELSARAYMQRFLEVGEHSARTLWLGIRIERSLGDLDAAASYALLLKTNYPDSDETRQLLQSETQWQ